MNKKLLALLLAVLMVCSLLAACGSTDEKKNNSSSTTGSSSVSGAEDDSFAEIDSYVSELAANSNYDGKTFTIIGTGGQIIAEKPEITGNLENDTLYTRQSELEDKFGITIEFVESTADDANYATTGAETADRVNTDVMSNMGAYDLIQGNLMTCGQVMLNNGSIAPVNSVDPLDFSRSWWLSNIEDQFNIANQLYFLTGKIVPIHYHDGACLLFNKEVAENFDIPDLYELVESGEWTFDKMVEVASAIESNAGVYRVLTSGASGGLTYYYGAGYTIAQRNDDGSIFVNSALSNDEVDFIDKLQQFFTDSSVMNAELNDTTDFYGFEEEKYAFIEDKVLFLTATMGTVGGYRTEDVEFGILPVPKKDAAQSDYISLASAWITAGVYISKVAKDIEMSATVTEAMAALSEKHLEPAYYEKALQGRGTYDSESKDMLDIIYKTKVIDLADTYQWGNLVDVINDGILGLKTDYVSSYSSSTKLANLNIQRLEKKVAASAK